MWRTGRPGTALVPLWHHSSHHLQREFKSGKHKVLYHAPETSGDSAEYLVRLQRKMYTAVHFLCASADADDSAGKRAPVPCPLVPQPEQG